MLFKIIILFVYIIILLFQNFISYLKKTNRNNKLININNLKPILYKHNKLNVITNVPINEPQQYTENLQGKKLRTYIYNIIAEKCDVLKNNKVNINYLIKAMESLHNSSLMIDDIQDKSILRRGKKCAYLIYGKSFTNMSAYYSVFNIIHDIILVKVNNPEITKIVMKSIEQTHLGQSMDIYWTNNNIIPTEDEYRLMISKKTGEIIKCFLNCCFSLNKKFKLNDKKIFSDLLDEFGEYYQINDDYLSIFDMKYMKKKGMHEDIYEKKYSFMVVHVIFNKLKNYNKLKQIITKTEKITEKDVKQYLSIMKENSMDIYTKNILNEIKKSILYKIKLLNLDIVKFNFIFKKMDSIGFDELLKCNNIQ